MKIPSLEWTRLDDESAKAATGKTMAEWFDHLDSLGDAFEGRRELTKHLYSELKLDEWWAVTIVVEYEKHKGALERDGKPKGYSICSTKTVSAPIEKTFSAFGDRFLLDRWFGPKTRVAFKDGGRFENADGDKGSFLRIRPGKDIRITWDHPTLASGSSVEVLFADKGKGKTLITLNHSRIADRRQADELRAAWSEAFESLKGLLESA